MYELYDGIPLIVKSVGVENRSTSTFKLNRVVNEVLGLVEEESALYLKKNINYKKPFVFNRTGIEIRAEDY